MKVVIVHDYLTQRGGAERVVLEMARAFPGSAILTSVYAPDRTYPEFRDLDVDTFWLQRGPLLQRDPRLALPVLADVFRRRKVYGDVVLCSSSGFAHKVGVRGRKIVYCHNPPRWLHQWDDYKMGLGPAERALVSLMRPYLCRLDRSAALEAASYLANSRNVAARVHQAYGIGATVVHPPRGLDPEGPHEPVPGLPERFLLTVGRPRGYKRTDLLAHAVAGMPDLCLVTVGSKPDRRWPANIHQLVGISDAQLRWLYARAEGLLACSFEDFGLTPVEAFGFGTPVAATREGGYLETCVNGLTGSWLDATSIDSLRATIRDFTERSWDAEAIRQHGERWTAPVFRQELHEAVSRVLSETHV
ncbi:glycosyltransferase [Geodermatophilus sp. SYSU D01036]